MIALYLTGILIGVLSGLALKGTMFRGKPVPFVMELPKLPPAQRQERGAFDVG
jgi:ferrous iron transport protein B